MLARRHRLSLRHHPDFFSTSRHFFTPELTFFYRFAPVEEGSVNSPLVNASHSAKPTSSTHPSPLLPPPQIAIIIPKKAVRLSITRHALKRRLAAAIYPQLSRFPAGLQLALVATPKINPAQPQISDIFRFLAHLNRP
jgi:ribonuclease P protein component